MGKRNSLLIAGFAGILALASAVPGRAITISPSTHTNRVTFNQPVKLPGVVLPAGTYEFELAPAGTHQDIVRVSGRTGRPYYLGFTRPVERPRAMPRSQVVEFGESIAGVPLPIAVWYPLNEASGHAFVYP
jgi:hypothetical protein